MPELWNPDMVHFLRAVHWNSLDSPEQALVELELIRPSPGELALQTPIFAAEVWRVRAEVAASLGEVGAARKALAEVEALTPHIPEKVRWRSLPSRIQTLIECGDLAMGHALVETAVSAGARAHNEASVVTSLTALLVRELLDESVSVAEAMERCLALKARYPASGESIDFTLNYIRAMDAGDLDVLERAAVACEVSATPVQAIPHWLIASLVAGEVGARESALAWARRCFELGRALAALLPGDAARAAHAARLRPAALRLVGLLAGEFPDEALSVTLQSKAGALFQLIRARAATVDSRSGGRPTMKAGALRPSFASELGAASETRGTRALVEASLETVRSTHERLSALDDQSRALVTELEVRAPQVCASLPPGSAGVEWLLGDDEVFTFVASASGVRVFRSNWGELEADALRALPAQLRRDPGVPWTQGDETRLGVSLARLHAALLAPAAAALEGMKRLVLSPGARLSAIPFAALAPQGSEPLLCRYDLSFVLSLAQLPLLRPVGQPVGAVLAIRGDDAAAGEGRLVAADDEVEAVRALARQNGLSAPVPDGAWEPALEQAQLVHYAGHAHHDGRNGMASSLFLPGQVLTAASLLGLDLTGVRLVTLSGCETARASDARTDEHLGLLRAVFAAGARGALATAWRVDDAGSAHVVEQTYQRWFSGEPLDTALSAVLRDVRRTGGPGGAWRHPVHWTAFGFYGVA